MREKSANAALSAELLEDGGEAARSSEFFRCSEFLAAEGVTHTLIAEGGASRVALPLIVREIPGSDRIDAISPYGYPGGELHGSPPAARDIDWSGSGLVSIFVRDRAGEPTFAGGTERSTLQIADPELPPKSRMSDRQQIRKNERLGYAVRSVAGPEASDHDRLAFQAVYEQTMRRTDAAERYFFSDEYFDRVLSSDRTWLFVVEVPGDVSVAAGSIAALSDGYLHYYLSGTADDHIREAPMKNLLASVIAFAERLGVPLNLGGGITPGDGLEEFKRGFANRQLPFVTHEIVCDAAAYQELSQGRAASGFFPAYRSG